jgi:hypothetical protein
VSNRGNGRVVIEAGSAGLRIEIRPLARTGGGRARLAAAVAVVLGAALYGTAHLAQVWESGLRKGDYDLPLTILIGLTLSVAIATPLALLGLSAVAFAEETIAVGPEDVTIETATFEKTRVRRIPLCELLVDLGRQTPRRNGRRPPGADGGRRRPEGQEAHRTRALPGDEEAARGRLGTGNPGF